MEPGTSLGPYTILKLLDVGGMGRVYEARDNRLHRHVALKLLPPELAQDSQRLARLRAEARALAATNHPNIAVVHSLEEIGDVTFLVMELIEGPTLAQLLRRGHLGTRNALEICRQIAEGLESAHRKGIVHRDLKPANVMITQGDQVKIVDFGLAKSSAPPEGAPSASDALTSSMSTASGTVLGTAPYMSPEQARGEPVDERTDVWAFGCVLYEALTGQPAFKARTVADTAARILEAEPQWDRLPRDTPAVVRMLQQRCLKKSVRHRLQSIGDARVIIEEALSAREGGADPRAGAWWGAGILHRAVPGWLFVLTAGGVVGAVLWAGWLRPRPRVDVRTLEVSLPAGYQLVGPPTFAPDGRRLAFAAAPENPRSEASRAPVDEAPDARLFVRSTVTGETKELAHTAGASYPFFSPDGEWIGFFAGGELKKVPLDGGEPVALCEVRGVSRAAWGPDDRIYFSPSTSKNLAWVSALGGAPQGIPQPEGAPVGLDSPEVLPGGGALLVRVFAGRESPIGVLSLKTGRLVTLQERGIDPRYVASGHIVYIRGGGLMAVPFDLGRQQVTGPETQVVSGVVQYAVSPDGSLAYMPGNLPQQKTLVWVDRTGRETPLDLPAGRYGSFQLSPDGNRLAMEVEGATVDVWVYDLEHGTHVRLTHDGNNGGPTWVPAGDRVAFCSDRGGSYALYWMNADGSGDAHLLPSTKTPLWHAWSPDGRRIAITDVSLGQPDIWMLETKEGAKPFPLRDTARSEWGAAFSPDGRGIAYASDESGRFEIYVDPAPGQAGVRRKVSTSGGEEPRWSRKGDELFYRNGRAWTVAPVKTTPSFTSDVPRVLFEGDYLKVSGIPYDVSPDGQKLLVLKPSREGGLTPFLILVLNWQAELPRLAASR